MYWNSNNKNIGEYINEDIINEMEQLLDRIYKIIQKRDWKEGRNLLSTTD